MRRRPLWAAAAVAAVMLALPVAAEAVLSTVRSPADPAAKPSCPGTAALPCTVVSRTTAYQVVVGHTYQPMRVKHDGRLVGWEITLSAPSTSETHYFDSTEGGPAQAAIAVLRHVRGLDYRVVATTPIVHLTPYFGHTATFALETSMPIQAGDIIGLSVPTWAPALELRAGRRTAWRASRPSSGCKNVVTNTAQMTAGSVAQYACIYQTALVHFGAIEISTP